METVPQVAGDLVAWVRPDVLTQVREHAAGVGREECCGALLGRGGVVVRAQPLANEASERTNRYFIGPRSVLALEAAAVRAGLEVIGFYHSHPSGGAEPSKVDLGHAWPGYLYLIVSPGDGADGVRGWRLREDRRGFLPVRIVEENGG